MARKKKDTLVSDQVDETISTKMDKDRSRHPQRGSSVKEHEAAARDARVLRPDEVVVAPQRSVGGNPIRLDRKIVGPGHHKGPRIGMDGQNVEAKRKFRFGLPSILRRKHDADQWGPDGYRLGD